MRIPARLRVLPLCLVLIAVLLCPGAASADKLVIASDEWCPHNCDPDSNKPGYMIEIARVILGKAGVTVEYQLMDWDESIEAATAGQIGAIVGAIPAEAPKLVFPAAGTGISRMVYAARADSKVRFNSVADLEKIKVGVIEGYAYDEAEFDDYVAKHAKDPKRVVVASGDENPLDGLIVRLMRGEVDLIASDEAVLNYRLLVMGMSDALKIVRKDLSDEIFIAFSPKNPASKQYAERITKGMAELRASGQLAKILAQYGVKDWK